MQLWSLSRIGIHARKYALAQKHIPGWGHWLKGESGERVYQSRCERCGEFVRARQYINVFGRKTLKAYVVNIDVCKGPESP